MHLRIRSPWIHQLNRTRAATGLDHDLETDVAVVGAGIAGVSTAYFLLRDTTKRVVLLDAGQVAHGASGHNGGILVPEFERSFSSLVSQFGLKMAAEGLRAITSAWDLLDDIHRDMNLATPVWKFTGYGGLSDPAQILDYLGDALLRREAGVRAFEIVVAEEWQPGLHIPAKYEGLYAWKPQADILASLETTDPRYIGMLSDIRGCMNSALFCDELAQKMATRWPDRLAVYEMTPVRTLLPRPDGVDIRTSDHAIRAHRAILCTNGFEGFEIITPDGGSVNTKFHHEVQGMIGYMAAITQEGNRQPAANFYEDQPGIDPLMPYFYLARRPYPDAVPNGHTLLSIGGPEAVLPEGAPYAPDQPFPPHVMEEIEAFMRRTHPNWKGLDTDTFLWHGLMGYTRSGVRLIGPEPCSPTLLYNLGCNGIGLLPSIYGGFKIGRIINEVPQQPSIFDPEDGQCLPSRR
jgi:glycine/D-amino acid oxidase-like deaminating enzyme